MSETIKRDAAFAALKFIYPSLKVQKQKITPQAAALAFKILYKVDKGARFSSALFKLNTTYISWTQIPTAFAKAVWELLKKPDEKFKNAISIALIAKQHRRNLRHHLEAPETFPCPDFKY